jgi:hypothetical protein
VNPDILAAQIAELSAENSRLRQVIKRAVAVVSYDWSEHDPDASSDMDALRWALHVVDQHKVSRP